MIHLDLAITDFDLPVEADSAPRLDALGRLLARGGREPAGLPGWRHWMLQAAGLRPPEQLPVARILSGRAGDWAVATPVHLLAGLEHVHLDPAGLPVLTSREWQELVGDFNRLFAEAGLALSYDGEVALLACQDPLHAVTHDPQPLAGRDAGAWLPSGSDGGRLRRLMTEMQMWLHEHPINMARARRDDPPVNGLWIWGLGGDSLAPVTSLPRLSTADPFLRRFWCASGAACEPTPPSLDAWLSAPDSIVTLELAPIAGDPALALQRAEESWFAPLERALASGAVDAARLFLGGTVATVAKYDRLRFWRRRRDWHEALR
jgi:hypothetical protein